MTKLTFVDSQTLIINSIFVIIGEFDITKFVFSKRVGFANHLIGVSSQTNSLYLEVNKIHRNVEIY